jgi:flagellar biosynthesis protein FlhG
MTRVVTIASGKGGVGKTNLSVNVALCLAALGHKTCLFDADLGLANINIMLGVNPERTLGDVIGGSCRLEEVIIKDYRGIDIIPGSTGLEEMANLNQDQVEWLIESFSSLEDYDFLLFDTSAGIAKNVICFCLASSEVVLLITPEPTSLTDAYALMKVMARNRFDGTVGVVLNQPPSPAGAKLIYSKFKAVVRKYLDIEVGALGMVAQDPKVVEAVTEQKPVISLFPDCEASKCIAQIARRLSENDSREVGFHDMETFWRRCLNLISGKGQGADHQEPIGKAEQQPSFSREQAHSTTAERPDRNSTPERSSKPAPPPKPFDVRIGDQIPEQTKQDEVAPAEKPIDGERVEVNPGDGIYILLNRMVDGLSAVSSELKLLRQAIGNGGQPWGATAQGWFDGQGAPLKVPIKLDFEEFLARRKKHSLGEGGNE